MPRRYGHDWTGRLGRVKPGSGVRRGRCGVLRLSAAGVARTRRWAMGVAAVAALTQLQGDRKMSHAHHPGAPSQRTRRDPWPVLNRGHGYGRSFGVRGNVSCPARAEGALLGLQTSDNQMVYPVWQFHRLVGGHVEVRPGLAHVPRTCHATRGPSLSSCTHRLRNSTNRHRSMLLVPASTQTPSAGLRTPSRGTGPADRAESTSSRVGIRSSASSRRPTA